MPVRSETGTDGFSKGPSSWRLDGFQLVGHESTIRGEEWLCLLGPSPSQGGLAGYRHASRNFCISPLTIVSIFFASFAWSAFSDSSTRNSS